MTGQPKVWAGTALALLMASAQAAVAVPGTRLPSPQHEAGFVLVQDQQGGEEELLEQPRRKKQREKPAAEKQAPAAEEQQRPAAEQAEPQEEQPKPERRKKRDAERAAPAEEQQAQPQEEQSKPERRKKRDAGEQAAPAEEQAAPAAREQQAEPQGEQPKPERRKKRDTTEQAAPAEEDQQAPADRKRPAAEKQEQQPASEEQPKPDRRKKTREKPAAEEQDQAAPAPGEEQQQLPADNAPVPEEGQGARTLPPADESAPADKAGGQDQDAGQAGRETPVLDSQKEPPPAASGTQEAPRKARREKPREPAEAGPPPSDDKAAQKDVAPIEIKPVDAEQGKRIEEAPDFRRQRRPKGVDVLREIGDRVIIELGNQVMVESSDRPRMSRGARDVYYEDLPGGRTRETIERENGIRVVTVRNRYGDIVRRSRITPDGREYVLSYAEEDREDDRREWRDPGDDLPPMRLNVPVEDYILDSEDVSDPDRYYEFLDQPPVERVERLYSVDEVKRSARIRDKTRRIDLDTINFDFGSSTVAESQIPRLEGVAKAMERLLKQNPAETFLIEGHTDAVGSDVANLALSDRRAEAVADALSNVFGIPPENLATQGYGEQFLKVRTETPERENRRVAIRRITPLVAPVASAN